MFGNTKSSVNDSSQSDTNENLQNKSTYVRS